MHLEQDFLHQWCITEYTCDKQFASKKNDVYLVSVVINETDKQYFVVKEYRDETEAMAKEAFLLDALYKKGVCVPKLYYSGKGYIVMEYINGAPLIDVLTDAEYYTQQSIDYINLEGIAAHLVRWLDGFYKAAADITGTGTILWDINLRNFLVGYRLYGIDFEEYREGAVEEDIGRLMAFAITYEPAFTEFKMRFAREILSAIEKRRQVDKSRVMDEIIKELDAIQGRRDIVIPQDIDYGILLGEGGE
jgi:tRNA A-37 threonylcarbamoyl transferase component Bud32